jgi:hypothetical protein
MANSGYYFAHVVGFDFAYTGFTGEQILTEFREVVSIG